MDTNYKIFLTSEAIHEMDSIYDYISRSLYAPNSARKLMNQIEEEIRSLKQMPHRYGIIKKIPELDLEYRRLVVKNFVIIYTISEEEHLIYIVHTYYGRSNYLNIL